MGRRRTHTKVSLSSSTYSVIQFHYDSHSIHHYIIKLSHTRKKLYTNVCTVYTTILNFVIILLTFTNKT